MCDSHANDWECNPLPPWSCLCKDELSLKHSFRLTIACPMLAAMMVPRASFSRKKSGQSHQKRAMLLIQRTVWNVGNNRKKCSWEHDTVGLMLFRCDYAGEQKLCHSCWMLLGNAIFNFRYRSINIIVRKRLLRVFCGLKPSAPTFCYFLNWSHHAKISYVYKRNINDINEKMKFSS